jgi:hypothetical protein
MNKKEFIEDSNVANFIKWMRVELKGSGRELNRWISQSNMVSKNRGDELEFKSLYDGFSQFYWRSTDSDGNECTNFQETGRHLSFLKVKLNESLNKNETELCAQACKDVLIWGGVYHKRTIALEIRNLSENNPDQLVVHLKILKSWLNSDPAPNTPLALNQAICVDSGTTKIYSLLSPSWIIYDGRVGTALGLLVSRWAHDNKIHPNDIPVMLRFSHGREAKRNPKFYRRCIFPVMENTNLRLTHNLYANWLLAEVLKGEDIGEFKSIEESSRLRALEAALFMIGYSVQEVRQTWPA